MDDGHAPRPRTAALRARSPLSIQVNRGRRCVSLDASGCARIGADGYCGPARGRAPAGSGGFRRKWAPISPWSWTSVRFSAGVVRCRLRRPGETPAPRGVSSRFGLRNRPEVCRWGSQVARGARRHCGEQERGFRQVVSVWSLWGRSVPHAHRGMGVAWRRRRVRTVAMHHAEGRSFHDNISRTAWRPQLRISRSNPR